MHHHTRKLITAAFILLGATLFLQSCRCGGADDIVTITGLDMTAPDSANVIHGAQLLQISTTTTSRQGGRKCHTKDLVLSIENSITASSVKVYANKALALQNKTIAANDNILKYRDDFTISGFDEEISVFNGCYIIFRTPAGTTFEKGVYTFYVTGTTDKGVNLTDSASVLLYQ